MERANPAEFLRGVAVLRAVPAMAEAPLRENRVDTRERPVRVPRMDGEQRKSQGRGLSRRPAVRSAEYFLARSSVRVPATIRNTFASVTMLRVLCQFDAFLA